MHSLFVPPNIYFASVHVFFKCCSLTDFVFFKVVFKKQGKSHSAFESTTTNIQLFKFEKNEVPFCRLNPYQPNHSKRSNFLMKFGFMCLKAMA